MALFLFGGLSELYAHLNDDHTAIANIQYLLNNNDNELDAAFIYTLPVHAGKSIYG